MHGASDGKAYPVEEALKTQKALRAAGDFLLSNFLFRLL